MIVEKGRVVFKKKAEDFVVEEIGIDGNVCGVSGNIEDVKKSLGVDFGKLDVNDRRDFLMCEMEKVDIDHFSAMGILGKEIGNNSFELGYAGTKDKAAWTCQKISIFNADVERIRRFSYEGIILKNFRWGKHKIKIGDLKGNRFRVVLRDADEQALKNLKRVVSSEKVGNYFGLQRFGSLRNDNYKIGYLILKRKFAEAVFAYLTGFGAGESEEVKRAKKKLKEEKDFVGAMAYFPEELFMERKMLAYLKENTAGWIGALNVLGEKTLTILCQSVQSRIFNDLLQRVIENGIEVEDLSIIGYDFRVSSGRIGKVELEIMDEHDMNFNDFKVKEFSFLNLRSTKRKAFMKVRDISAETVDDEEFSGGKKVVLSFVLDSGCYATTFLENFFDLD